MSDFRRRLMMLRKSEGGLPSGYTRLNYLESTGTQYINTGVIANQDTGIEMKYEVTKIQSNLRYALVPFGAREAYQKRQFVIFSPVNASNLVHYCYGNDFRAAGTSLSVNKAVNVSIRGNIWKTSLFEHTFAKSVFETPYNLSLFTANCKPVSGFNGCLKIYFTQIYDKDKLIKDFIPAKRISDNEVGMYDKISRKFFINQGTGEFLYG